MSDSVTLQFRGLVIEDFMTSNILAQTTATVLGLGPGISVTPIVQAASDAAASAAGVPVGGVYIYNGSVPYYLRTRMS